MSSPLDSTYGVWLVSLFLETILYGMGLLQTYIYFSGPSADVASVKRMVLLVLVLETIQIVFFFRSSYFRFVEQFGQIQTDLIWADSLQLLAAYLSAFTVQLYFASRIYSLTKTHGKFSLAAFGLYTILLLSVVQIVAGVVQTVWSYELGSYLKLGETKAITTLQSAASFACDVLITVYLYLFLKSHKGNVKKTNSMINMLILDAVNRGILTALSSCLNMVLFLAKPDTFWFFLGLAPSSKLFMNSMLSTLNTRQQIRDKLSSNDKGWNSIQMGTLSTGDSHSQKRFQSERHASVAVELEIEKAASVGRHSSVTGVAV
ncbi:hypothetical protein MSAN_02497100 [Mycena sanguinolenta]|uniref:DUF6534 domain-containing protein n=1 Tax=Mycena sanguinolenta TaxID=230812 RepID=A0A8H6U1S6_9AGAR|nr:hypothetical protein MSAN_02497100 [Mycena sanguinolenta]